MKKKEKAKSIIDIFFKLNYLSINQCKQCALIAVDEIRDNLPFITDIQNYWIDVKNEIEKL